MASSFDPSSPWEAYVRNHTFEYGPDLTSYLWTIDGAGNGSYSTGSLDPTPDPDDAAERLVHTDNGTYYQVLDGLYLEADATYELTVDVGDRNDLNFVDGELRMGTGSTVGNNLLTATVVSNTTPVSGWETWVSTFTVGSGVVGDPLRIELTSSGQRTHWDNVRLSVTPPPSGGGTVFIFE